MLTQLSLNHYLILSAGLFAIGLYGVLTRRNVLGILMSIELMFNAANINLVAFDRFLPRETLRGLHLHGQVFTLFVIAIVAAEAVVGLALILSIYRNLRSVFVEKMNILKW